MHSKVCLLTFLSYNEMSGILVGYCSAMQINQNKGFKIFLFLNWNMLPPSLFLTLRIFNMSD